jgi:AcrR family transcriptional regulator
MIQTKAEHSLATRRKLEEVARALFAARGFAGVSAEELVAAAEVTRGALYHHYDGKEGLFAAVVETTMREMHAGLVQAAAGARDPLQALERGAAAFLKLCLEPGVRRILLVDGPAVLGWAKWREMDAAFGLGLVKQALAAATKAGLIDCEDVDVAAHLLLGALTEAAMLIARSPDPEKTLESTERALKSLLSSLRRPDRGSSAE